MLSGFGLGLGGVTRREGVGVPIVPTTMVVVGDSNISNGGGTGVNRSTRPGSPWPWAQITSGHRLDVRNSGVGGETSVDVRARWNADVIAHGPEFVHLLMGTNDAGTDESTTPVSLEDTKANILWCVDRSLAQGSNVSVGTIPPRGGPSGSTARGTAAKAHALGLNEWITDTLPTLRPAVDIVDYYDLMVDGTTDEWIDGYAQSDGTHFSGRGGLVASAPLSAYLAANAAYRDRVLRTEDAANIIGSTRGLFAGASAGVAPTGWFTSQAAMIQGLEARTDGKSGNWLVVVVPNGSTFSMSRDITSGVSVGANVRAAVEFEASGIEQPATPTVANQSFAFGLLLSPDFINAVELSRVTAQDQPHSNLDRSGVLECPPFTRTVSETGVQVAIQIAGGGTYKFSCATVTDASWVPA